MIFSWRETPGLMLSIDQTKTFPRHYHSGWIIAI